MKTFLYLILLSVMTIPTNITVDTIYDFKPTNINGKETSLNKFKGDVLLIVNTASECGYTPQYEGLQALQEKYNKKGFNVLGFPANNFGGQEPGTDKQIKKFCKVNYDVSFPMFSKISVKGKDQHPLFDYLTSAQNPDFTGAIKWNFEKFLISKDGKLLHRFRSDVEPESDELTNAIENALNQ
ncbi:glutathione peroxidase [Fodinibius halophilus]|uniref:Glutathione peroxidase n=1 Tax=Fodinibius halophilus TaxID=1736908 RepID=A0A6M1SZR6_9BACT|nr:glutathione peroxidase [Fodinibius halophilus]NGP87167.1 glutathione peroxidase [Fodinibius halophilus]